MKEIGGFFELELIKGKEYHSNALRLNSGRNALWYFLETIKPQKIYVPRYICNAVLEPINKMKMEFEFYNIDEKFNPIIPTHFDDDKDYFLYVNYFGTNDHIVMNLSYSINNLIIDNSQAFYCMPIKNPTFYSPRKFFGVPDGGYLYTSTTLSEELKRSVSYNISRHIIKKIDLGSDQAYDEYSKAEQKFSNQPIMLMSKLTQEILSSINYDEVKSIREQNFRFIHKSLKDLNELKINLKHLNGPMKYPLLIRQEGIREVLINNKIYVSTYWQEVFERAENESFELDLAKYLLPLPIDQRYNIDDMKIIIKKIIERL